jgi:hypothetical protein
MTLPSSYNGSINNLHYYQGILIAEVALTLILYLLLKVIHYVKWGHDEEVGSADSADSKQAEVGAKKEGEEENTESRVRYVLSRNGTRRRGMSTFQSSLPTTLEPSL